MALTGPLGRTAHVADRIIQYSTLPLLNVANLPIRSRYFFQELQLDTVVEALFLAVQAVLSLRYLDELRVPDRSHLELRVCLIK